MYKTQNVFQKRKKNTENYELHRLLNLAAHFFLTDPELAEQVVKIYTVFLYLHLVSSSSFHYDFVFFKELHFQQFFCYRLCLNLLLFIKPLNLFYFIALLASGFFRAAPCFSLLLCKFLIKPFIFL